jgi:hypothetical protein
MKHAAIELPSGYRVRPLTWQEGRAIMRPLFNGREHWTMVIHGSAVRLLIEIEERYYTGKQNADLIVITAFHRGHPFAIVAAKKRHMLAHQYASLLRQITGAQITERTLLKRDLEIIAPPWAMEAATELVVKLLSGDDLAMSE